MKIISQVEMGYKFKVQIAKTILNIPQQISHKIRITTIENKKILNKNKEKEKAVTLITEKIVTQILQHILTQRLEDKFNIQNS